MPHNDTFRFLDSPLELSVRRRFDVMTHSTILYGYRREQRGDMHSHAVAWCLQREAMADILHYYGKFALRAILKERAAEMLRVLREEPHTLPCREILESIRIEPMPRPPCPKCGRTDWSAHWRIELCTICETEAVGEEQAAAIA